MGALTYSLLSDVQCDRLLNDCAGLPKREGRVYSGRGPQGFKVDPAQYKAREAYIDLFPPHTWLRSLLQSALDRAAVHFGQTAAGLLEMPRLLTYDAGSHFDWHVDALPGNFTGFQPSRRLTGSIQLSNEDEYTGGELLVLNADKVETAPRARGSITLFPAVWRHKVAPIASGTRLALVLWGYA